MQYGVLRPSAATGTTAIIVYNRTTAMLLLLLLSRFSRDWQLVIKTDISYRDTDVENKRIDTKWGKGGCGMNWETGIDILTLLLLSRCSRVRLCATP